METFPNLEALFVSLDDQLEKAMEVFNENAVRTDGSGIALVVKGERELVGVVTDGDVRRALLKGHSLKAPVSMVMSKNPTIARQGMQTHQMLRLFDRGVRHVPVVDAEGRVIDLLLYSQFRVAPEHGGAVVRAKAPLRISFAGGGTDFTQHFEHLRSTVIGVTIDRYCHGTLIKRQDHKIILRSEDFGLKIEAERVKDLIYNGKLDLLKAVIKLLKPDFGFELTSRSDIEVGTGLGASAAMAVVVIGLFNEMLDRRMNEYQISDLAYQAERIELGVHGGWQDQYAVAFGGLNYIEFTDREVIVHPLALKDRVVHELEESLLLCPTGQIRNSGDVHAANSRSGKIPGGEILTEMCRLAVEIKNALVQEKLSLFGTLMDQAWWLKKQCGDVSNERIDYLYKVAQQAGSIGGKLLGAGKGGYLVFFCPPLMRMRVAKALEQAGSQPVSFNFDFRGLRVWRPPAGYEEASVTEID